MMEDNLPEKPISNPPTDKQLKQLNWPSLAFPWIWCFFHRLYLLGIVSLVPVVNLFIRFYLLFNGNRLDWERNNEKGVEKYLRRRKRWNSGTAAIVICFLAVAGLYGLEIAHKEWTVGFSWKQYSFENNTLLVHLPFELKKTESSIPDEKIVYGQTYEAGNDRLNIALSYMELKADYGFVLEDLFRYSLEGLQNVKDFELVNRKYEEFKCKDYSAGKMTIEYVSAGTKRTAEYVYILVAANQCWYLMNTYPTGKTESKEASDRIFSSIKLTEQNNGDDRSVASGDRLPKETGAH